MWTPFWLRMDPDSRCKAVPVRGAVDARAATLHARRSQCKEELRAGTHGRWRTDLLGVVALPVTGVYDGRGRASVTHGGRVGSFP